MRHRLIHPIKIIIQHSNQSKPKELSNSNNSKYKFLSVGLSCLLAISESLPLMSNVKSNGLIHIIQDTLKGQIS